MSHTLPPGIWDNPTEDELPAYNSFVAAYFGEPDPEPTVSILSHTTYDHVLPEPYPAIWAPGINRQLRQAEHLQVALPLWENSGLHLCDFSGRRNNGVVYRAPDPWRTTEIGPALALGSASEFQITLVPNSDLTVDWLSFDGTTVDRWKHVDEGVASTDTGDYIYFTGNDTPTAKFALGTIPAVPSLVRVQINGIASSGSFQVSTLTLLDAADATIATSSPSYNFGSTSSVLSSDLTITPGSYDLSEVRLQIDSAVNGTATIYSLDVYFESGTYTGNVTKTPTTAGTDLTGSTWQVTPNIKTEDGAYSFVVLPTTAQSNRLRGQLFNFEVPSAATIKGIEVEIECYATGSGVIFSQVQLGKTSVAVGNNLAASTAIPTTHTTVTFGSSSQLWGTTWTSTELDSSGFAVFVRATNNAGVDRTALIDVVRVRVYYEDSANGYAVIPSKSRSNLDMTAMTVCAWVKSLDNTDTTIAAQHQDDGAGSVTEGWEWEHVLTDRQKFTWYSASAVSSLAVTGTLPVEVGAWYHLAATVRRNGANYYTDLYVNGILDNSGNTNQIPATTTAALVLGQVLEPDLTPRDSTQFSGYLKDVRVYDTALTAAAIQEIAGFGRELYTRKWTELVRLPQAYSETPVGGVVVSGEAEHWTDDEGKGGIVVGIADGGNSTVGQIFANINFSGGVIFSGEAVVETSYEKKAADALQYHLTGAASHGAAQADSSLSLGGYRSPTVASRIGILKNTAVENVRILGAAGANGPGNANLMAIDADTLVYTAPDGSPGEEIEVKNGFIRQIPDGSDPSKFIRVIRTSTESMQGNANVEYHWQYNNVFGMDDSETTETTSGGNRYRAVMVWNDSELAAEDVSFWVKPLSEATPQTSTPLAATGAGSIVIYTHEDLLCDWPLQGWARIADENGALREIVYYSSRTSTSLTVPVDGRGRLGTSAAAGGFFDRVVAVPGIRIAWEDASPLVDGSVQTIANESTAPTGLTWSTGIDETTGVSAGDIGINEQGALWIHRELPANTAATPRMITQIAARFTWDGTTYTETLCGLYRCENTAHERYEVHVGVNAEPDLSSAPTATSTTLPINVSLTAGATNYVVTNRRNKWNMASELTSFEIYRLDGAGEELDLIPSTPVIDSWEASSGGTFILKARYIYEQDLEDNRGDQFNIYFTSNGVDPTLLDVPTVVTFTADEMKDGAVWLEWTSGSFAAGTVGKVMLTVERAADSAESLPTDIYSATAEDTGPIADELHLFKRGVAEMYD